MEAGPQFGLNRIIFVSGSGHFGVMELALLGTTVSAESNSDQRPTCECPPGYSLLDRNDAYGSCKIDYELGCAEKYGLKI